MKNNLDKHKQLS